MATQNVVMRERRRGTESRTKSSSRSNLCQYERGWHGQGDRCLRRHCWQSAQRHDGGTGELSPLRQTEKDLRQASHLGKRACVEGRSNQRGVCQVT